MGIVDWLFSRGGNAPAGGSAAGDTESVRRLVSELKRLDRDEARYVAAFAYVLGRAANADHDISSSERAAMERIVERVGHLSPHEAQLAVEIAAQQTQLFGGTEDFVVTREFRDIASDQQRRELLECLFAVCAADDTISAEEDHLLRQIASELGFTHQQYVEARLPYSDKRALFQQGSKE